MTIKELAYSAQQHLQASTGGSFKRAHVYELLAASFGFNSHAAFGIDAVLTELRQNDRRVVPQSALIKRSGPKPTRLVSLKPRSTRGT